MKGFFKYIAVALAMSLLAIGCTPEIMTPDQGKLPEASAMEVVITPDQTTNFVTFSVKNANGIVPMWIFGEDLIDGKANKKFAYVGNDIVLRIREAGTHKVEVKAYNAHGVSVGSQIASYTLDNTYRDPFDPTPYMKAVAGEWQWNNEADKHFGCGPNLSDPISWWGAGANEKADWSLYNDHMTFTEDGKYFFDPGEDGKVYVNVGFSALGTSPDGNDFLVDIPAYETTYAFENNWNDAGIEEIWLVLPEHKNLSYIPNQTIYDNPRFLVMDSKTSAMRKELKLAAAEAPNGEGTISWYYNFIPAVHVATPEELLAGTDAAGKVWIMDAAAQGHLGCGDSVENPAGWWSAPAFDKKDFGLYDDAITFTPDGKYIYDSGEDGKMYINWGVTVIGPNPGAEPDIDIEQADVESTYTFDGETITLAANTPMVYVPSDLVWETPVFHVTSLTETTLVVVAENPGCYWQMIFKARDVQAPAGPALNGEELPAELSVAQGDVLEVSNLNLADIWVDPDFFDVDGNNLKFKAVDGDYMFTYDATNKWIKVVPMDNGEKATYSTGGAIWVIGDGGGKPAVGQNIGWNTGEAPLPFARISENMYRITLAMIAEGGSIKLFEQPDWGDDNTGERVWLTNRYNSFNGNGFFKLNESSGNIETDGATPGYYTFTVVDNGGGAIDMTVEKYRDPNDIVGLANMWDNAAINLSFWFANDGWAQIENPEYENDGNAHTLTVPEGTGASQWQGQTVFNHTGLVLSPEKKYTFKVTFLSSADHPHVTVKPCYEHPTEKDGNGNPADVNELLYKNDIVLVADEEFVFTAAGVQGTDIPDLKLVFDFGGAVAGSTITIKDIILVEL